MPPESLTLREMCALWLGIFPVVDVSQIFILVHLILPDYYGFAGSFEKVKRCRSNVSKHNK